MGDETSEGTEGAGITDSGVVMVGDQQVAELGGSGLQRLRVPVDEQGGVLFVTWPEGELPTVDEVLATLGEPSEVKGPSATVWGAEHAAHVGDPTGVDVTPQGDGEPVKGPAEDFYADEVLDPEPQE